MTAENMVFATEIIGNQRPGKVTVSGDNLMLVIAGQFLRAAGYSETQTPNEYAR